MPKLQTNNVSNSCKQQQSKCCARGCKFSSTEGNNLHRFPNPHRNLERFKYWIKVLNNPELNSISHDLIYNNKRVCSKHFEKKYQSGRSKIQRNGIPSLHLKSAKSEPVLVNEDMEGSKKESSTEQIEAIYLPNTENVSPKVDSTTQPTRKYKRKSILLNRLRNTKDTDIIIPFSQRKPHKVYTKKPTTTTNPKPPTAETETCPQLNKIRDLFSSKTENNSDIQLQVSHEACSIIGISLRPS